MGRFIKVLHTCGRYANMREGNGNGNEHGNKSENENENENENVTQPQTCMVTFNYILRRCACVCVCQLHAYDKPSDRQLEKRRKGVWEGGRIVSAELAKRK